MRPQRRYRCTAVVGKPTGWNPLVRCDKGATHKLVIRFGGDRPWRCSPTYQCASHTAASRSMAQKAEPFWPKLEMTMAVYRFRRFR